MTERTNPADELAFIVNNATALRNKPATELTIGMPVTQLFYSDRSVWVVTGIRGKVIDLHRAVVKYIDGWVDGHATVIRDDNGNIVLNNTSAVTKMSVMKFRNKWYKMNEYTGERSKATVNLVFGVADGYRDPVSKTIK